MRNRLLTVLAGLLIVGSLFWGYQQHTQRQRLDNLLNSRYQQAFFNLLEHVEQSQVLLAKTMVTNSAQQRTALLSDVWYEANVAQENLNQLPVAQPILGQTAKFLTQVGDYSLSVLKQNEQGKALDDNQLDQITSLHNRMLDLTRKLQKIRADVVDGKLTWAEIKENSQGNLPEGKVPEGENSFRAIDQELMQDQPVLIYDGPFSDHLEIMQPKGLGGKDITEDEAQDVVRQFLGISDDDQNWRSMVKKDSNPGGKIPAYAVQMENDNSQVVADVSKKGGKIVWLAVNRSIGTPKLAPEAARVKAIDFLKNKGFKDVKPSFMKINQRTVTVVLVPLQDNVLIYPDQVKVEIALDNGQVVGYEALGFIMANHEREFPEIKVTKEEAQKTLNDQLDVNRSALALIPLRSGNEVLTWEFRGTYKGDTFFTYINVENGNEEQIFQVITNDNGELAL